MFEYFMSAVGLALQAKDHIDNYDVRKSEAESALRQAFRCTKKHIKTTRTEFGDEDSTELANKWKVVAEKIRPFDKDTANILEMKADYWIDVNGFKNDIQDGNRRFDYRFRLNEIEKLIR